MQAHWLSDARNETEEEVELRPHFYMGSMLDAVASKKAGREIFRDVPFVRIRIPNDRTVVADRLAVIDEDPISPDPRADNVRFPRYWERFKKNESQENVGTPLRELPMFSRAIVETYAAQGVLSLEQLAALSDNAAQAMTGGLPNRTKARALIAQASGGAAVLQMRGELDSEREQNAELKKLLQETAARLDRLEKKPAKAQAPAQP